MCPLEKTRTCLSFLPLGLTLFEKCVDAFFGVFGGAQAGKGVVHTGKLLVVGHVFGAVKSGLGDLHGDGAFDGQFFGLVIGCGVQFILWNNAVDQSQVKASCALIRLP